MMFHGPDQGQWKANTKPPVEYLLSPTRPPCNPPPNVRLVRHEVMVRPNGGGGHHTMVALRLQQFQYNEIKFFFGAF